MNIADMNIADMNNAAVYRRLSEGCTAVYCRQYESSTAV
jgi:hypothetical protein